MSLILLAHSISAYLARSLRIVFRPRFGPRIRSNEGTSPDAKVGFQRIASLACIPRHDKKIATAFFPCQAVLMRPCNLGHCTDNMGICSRAGVDISTPLRSMLHTPSRCKRWVLDPRVLGAFRRVCASRSSKGPAARCFVHRLPATPQPLCLSRNTRHTLTAAAPVLPPRHPPTRFFTR